MRRLLLVLVPVLMLAAACFSIAGPFSAAPAQEAAAPALPTATGPASQALAALPVKDAASMTGYARTAFLPKEWETNETGGCDHRNDVLRHDLANPAPASGCIVRSGTLHDPYTGQTIPFSRSRASAVQIDHVVSLGGAWATGAAAWTPDQRQAFATDERLELLAVSGPQNERKGDKDASQWLPPDRSYACSYVARQVAIKATYGLWTTPLEHAAMAGVLNQCPEQTL